MSTYDPAALECLAALAEAGSFERAAQRLSITQSAVSQRLRALEADMGRLLVVRSRPLRLTGPGLYPDLVAMGHQFPHAGRRQANPVFVVLDFLRHRDTHGDVSVGSVGRLWKDAGVA